MLDPSSCQPIDAAPTGPVIDTPSTDPVDTTVDAPVDSTAGTEPQGLRRPVAPPADTVPGDTVPADTIPPGAVNEPAPTQFADPTAVLLPTRDGGAECLGPVQGTGEVFERGSAEPTLDPSQGWGVAVDLAAARAATRGTTWPASASTVCRPARRSGWRSCSTA